MALKNILIIEDDSMLQGVLTERLSDEGYVVRGCVTGEAAFEQIKSEKPDVILTDLVLPKMDGFDVLKAIKDSIHLNTIPVIIMSNSGQEGDPERASELGASDFIVKSNSSLDQIVERVKKVVSSLE